ncbi:DUF4189 domain-containing protein [Nocardia sp. NPDC051030]|uniref:DUF4189 domain-containing protein n=1 Tax=Nocardia sp. NPDC051030 TaxID=3155162 RepID=UPI0034141546
MKKIITAVAMAGAAVLAPVTPAHAYTYNYGAISIGNNWTYAAIAVNYPTWQDAASAANDRCGYTDCGYVLTFYNQCASAAVASSGHWGWAKEPSLSYADEVAMGWAGSGAYWVVHGCTDR